ncbi:MAG: beta-galactosidase [Armatimonadota bacterium]
MRIACSAAALALVVCLAKAGKPLDVAVKNFRGAPQLHLDGRPQVPLSFMGWFDGGATRVKVGAEWQRVIVQFTSPEDADGAAGFQIRMNRGGAGSVWIDDLRYYEGTPEKPRGPNMQPQGDFEDTGDKLPDRWALFFRQDLGEEGHWAYDETIAASGKRSLRVDVIKNAPGGFMHVYLSGCTVKKGHDYTVELSLRAEPERLIDVVALHQGPPWTIYSISGTSVYCQQVVLAAAAGVHHYQFGSSVPWPKEGEEVSYAGLDKAFQGTVKLDPEAVVALRFGVAPPKWWLEEHPGECTTFEDGSTEGFSVSSELWLKELLPKLEAYVRYIEEHWGDRCIIYFPCAQHTGEWFYPGSWTQHFPGFSPAATRGFRGWLERKYGTASELSQAWGREVTSFEQVETPTFDQRLKGSAGEFFHPARERYQVDFFEYLNDAMAEAMQQIAATIKRASGGRKAVMFFYGYLHELAAAPVGLAQSGHLRWSRFLEDPNVDIFCSPISYFDRQSGGSGHFMVPADTVAAHGKLWFNEDDTRTHVTPKEAGYGRCATLRETLGVHRRNFAQIFPRRMGCWYMDLGNAGWMQDKALWENIGEMRKFWEDHLEDPVRFSPEVAVVADEVSPLYTLPRSPVNRALLYDLRASITRLGAPVGWWLLEDLFAGKVKPAKLYIFPNAFALTGEQRARIREVLRRQKSTALWFYAPGYLDPAAGRVDASYVRELTGLSLEMLQEPVEDLVQPNAKAWLCQGLVESFGSKQKALRLQWGVKSEPGVEPLATYVARPELIAAASTRQDGWRSVYVASLYAPARLLRNIAREAGVWIYTDTDDVVLGDGRFLGLAASSEGKKTVRLPRPSVVRDCLSGRTVRRGSEIEMNMRTGDTRLLWVEERE